jgi:superfamily II DNA or RNA helicase
VKIHVDHKIRIARQEIPESIQEYLLEALSIPNIERQKQMEQGIWGWQQLPEKIDLWEWDHTSSHLVMPRGFLVNLLNGLNNLEIPWEIIDNRVWEPDLPMPTERIDLRPWQTPAVAQIAFHQQGIWKAPAGSGKTVGVLEAIRRSKSPSIVLVNTKDILYQWRDRAKTFLGEDFPVGLIGDGLFDVNDFLTISTVQTLHSRFEELERGGFFDQFSFMCLDECHHATADTYRKLVDRFSACIRIGVSATPDKTGDFALATNVLGPIFHETLKKDVGNLIEPEIFKVKTNFTFPFRERKGRTPSNYPDLLKCLIADEDRNALIVKSIMIDEGSHALVVSKRLEHLATLQRMLLAANYSHATYTLTGKESSALRAEVIQYISERPGVVFSTLADEALDIPRLDSLFLVFPQRNTGLIEQQVGRICRSHPDKDRAVVFDFADSNVGVLDNQWRVRRTQVYQPHGYSIGLVNTNDVMEYEPQT